VLLVHFNVGVDLGKLLFIGTVFVLLWLMGSLVNRPRAAQSLAAG